MNAGHLVLGEEDSEKQSGMRAGASRRTMENEV